MDPYPAPVVVLTDINPASATYNEQRRLSDMQGKVVVLYFASFG